MLSRTGPRLLRGQDAQDVVGAGSGAVYEQQPSCLEIRQAGELVEKGCMVSAAGGQAGSLELATPKRSATDMDAAREGLAPNPSVRRVGEVLDSGGAIPAAFQTRALPALSRMRV